MKYWGLGNEMDGPWQMGHRNADDYGKFALEAAKLMKWTDPEYQSDRRRLIASSRQGIDWIGWNRTVLSYLSNHVDYLSLHLYVGNPNNDYYDSSPARSTSTTAPRSPKALSTQRSVGHARRRRSTSPGTSGTSGTARAATSSAAAAFSRNATTSKTRSWSRHS